MVIPNKMNGIGMPDTLKDGMKLKGIVSKEVITRILPTSFFLRFIYFFLQSF